MELLDPALGVPAVAAEVELAASAAPGTARGRAGGRRRPPGRRARSRCRRAPRARGRATRGRARGARSRAAPSRSRRRRSRGRCRRRRARCRRRAGRPAAGSGSGMSTTAAEPAWSGITVSARMPTNLPTARVRTTIATSDGVPDHPFQGVRDPSGARGRAPGRARLGRRGDLRVDARHHRHGAAGAAGARGRRRSARGRRHRRGRDRDRDRERVLERLDRRPASRSTGSSSTPPSPRSRSIAAQARERATELASSNQALARDLHAAQARLDGILGSLGEAVTVHDERGKTVYANAAAAELLGCDSVEEVLAAEPGQLAGKFSITHEDGSAVRARGPPRAAPDRGRERRLADDAEHQASTPARRTGCSRRRRSRATPTAPGWRSTSSRTSPRPRTPSCASGSSPRPASCSPPRSTTSRRSSGSRG